MTKPIRKSNLPTTPPPEFEFSTVLGACSDSTGCTLMPGDMGPVVVRRRVTYGDWEPVRPDRWADEPEPGPAATEPTSSARELIAAAIYEHNNPGRPWANAHPHDHITYGGDADAVLAVILPGTRITATLARMADADVQRVTALYERWVAAGPPPLGTSLSRWWDARLVELHDAILPPTT